MNFSDLKVGSARKHEFKGVIGIGSIRVHLNRLSRLLSRKKRAFQRVVPVHLIGKFTGHNACRHTFDCLFYLHILKKKIDRV